MSKILEATCSSGAVIAGGLPVPAAEILSEGVGLSSGVLLMDQHLSRYVTSNASDIKTALEQIGSALTSIAAALTLLDAKPLGTLPAAPAAGASISQILAVQVQVMTLKEILK